MWAWEEEGGQETRGDSLSRIFTHIRREREGEQEGRPTPINEKRGGREGGEWGYEVIHGDIELVLNGALHLDGSVDSIRDQVLVLLLLRSSQQQRRIGGRVLGLELLDAYIVKVELSGVNPRKGEQGGTRGRICSLAKSPVSATTVVKVLSWSRREAIALTVEEKKEERRRRRSEC